MSAHAPGHVDTRDNRTHPLPTIKFCSSFHITRSSCATRLHPERRPTRIGVPPSAPAPPPSLRLHPQIPSIFTPLTSASRRASLSPRGRVAAASSRPGPRAWRGATWPAVALWAVSCHSSFRWTATGTASAARASALSFTVKTLRCVFVLEWKLFIEWGSRPSSINDHSSNLCACDCG